MRGESEEGEKKKKRKEGCQQKVKNKLLFTRLAETCTQ